MNILSNTSNLEWTTVKQKIKSEPKIYKKYVKKISLKSNIKSNQETLNITLPAESNIKSNLETLNIILPAKSNIKSTSVTPIIDDAKELRNYANILKVKSNFNTNDTDIDNNTPININLDTTSVQTDNIIIKTDNIIIKTDNVIIKADNIIIKTDNFIIKKDNYQHNYNNRYNKNYNNYNNTNNNIFRKKDIQSLLNNSDNNNNIDVSYLSRMVSGNKDNSYDLKQDKSLSKPMQFIPGLSDQNRFSQHKYNNTTKPNNHNPDITSVKKYVDKYYLDKEMIILELNRLLKNNKKNECFALIYRLAEYTSFILKDIDIDKYCPNIKKSVNGFSLLNALVWPKIDTDIEKVKDLIDHIKTKYNQSILRLNTENETAIEALFENKKLPDNYKYKLYDHMVIISTKEILESEIISIFNKLSENNIDKHIDIMRWIYSQNIIEAVPLIFKTLMNNRTSLDMSGTKDDSLVSVRIKLGMELLFRAAKISCITNNDFKRYFENNKVIDYTDQLVEYIYLSSKDFMNDENETMIYAIYGEIVKRSYYKSIIFNNMKLLLQKTTTNSIRNAMRCYNHMNLTEADNSYIQLFIYNMCLTSKSINDINYNNSSDTEPLSRKKFMCLDLLGKLTNNKRINNEDINNFINKYENNIINF